MRATPTGERAFTLTEAAIVVAILAMAASLVIPALGNSRAQLRKNAGLLASAMRAAYDDAALSGQTYRLGFVFGAGEKSARVKVEASPELLAFEPEDGAISRARKSNGGGGALSDWGALAAQFGTPDEDEEPKDMAALDELASGTLESMLGVQTEAESGGDDEGEQEGARADGFTAAHEDVPIDADVKLLDVWVEGMSEPASSGIAYIYFFPHGYSLEAMVHLEDEGGHVYTIQLAPLTGRPTVVDGYVEVPK